MGWSEWKKMGVLELPCDLFNTLGMAGGTVRVNAIAWNYPTFAVSQIPLDVTHIDKITVKTRSTMVSTNWLSITDEKLTNRNSVINNAIKTINGVADWAVITITEIDVSNLSGKKYIGYTTNISSDNAYSELNSFYVE